MKRTGWYWWIMPLAAILASAGIILVPALRAYSSLRQTDDGTGMLVVGRFAIRTDHLLRMSIDMSAIQTKREIVFLNAPGQLVYASIATTLGTSANSFPATFGLFFWHGLVLPLCTFPAWLFVGRGLDGWLASRRLRRIDLVVSLGLSIVFLSLSALLRFGITAKERTVSDLTSSYMYGFAFWALLIAIPAVVWTRQTVGADRMQL
jgi:hypothetical protein